MDRYLSGEIPLDRLPEEERLEEVRLRELLGMLEEDVRAPVSFHAAVMGAVAEIRASPWRRFVDWWLRTHTVRVNPAVGALAVAVAAAVFLLSPASEPSPGLAPAANGASQVVTRFVFLAPGASSVHLTGDFASWSRQGIALEDLRGTGIWTADVPLPPGVYQYTFVVNGTEWVPDPRATSQVDDGFGQMNSVVIVPGGGET